MGAIGWIVYAVVLAGLIALILMRRSGQLSAKDATEYIKLGAIIVDVRNPDEYSSGHLSQAFNFPLNGIEGTLPGKVKDKDHVLLLHCQSGLRSKVACTRLQKIGYKNVYNLGSYERAFKIVSGRSL